MGNNILIKDKKIRAEEIFAEAILSELIINDGDYSEEKYNKYKDTFLQGKVSLNTWNNYWDKNKEDNESYNIFTPEGQVKQFYKDQPYFYDNVKIFHLWNKEDKFWESCDEIDMLNKLKINIPNADTINAKTKSEIITALKQVGRNKKPKDAPKTWIQFKNKIVDIISGEEFEPSPKYYTTNPIPWNISDNPNTPIIDKLIEEWVVDNVSQNKTYIKTMKEIIAYTICSDQFLQRMFAFCGAGMNGKGTFIKLLSKFLGNKNYTKP